MHRFFSNFSSGYIATRYGIRCKVLYQAALACSSAGLPVRFSFRAFSKVPSPGSAERASSKAPLDVPVADDAGENVSLYSASAIEGQGGAMASGMGTSSEDAFGKVDAMDAIAEITGYHTSRNGKTHVKEAAVKDSAADGIKSASEEAAKAEEAVIKKEDPAQESGRKRRRRRMRNVDTILADVIHDALRLRDMGRKPSADFIYKRTQERMYEEEYGRKPPGAKEFAAKYVPFPPDIHLHRLFPLYEEFPDKAPEAGCGAAAFSLAGSSTSSCKPHFPNLMPEDPWPERAITARNPVWSKRKVEEDRSSRGGVGLKEWEDRLFNPRKGFDLLGEFTDAMDELRYWMDQFIVFLRRAPLTQRRTLPFLHEWHRLLVHRLIRAERRYGRVRNATLAHCKASTAMFRRTEEPLERARELYAEAHRSLSSPNYDPSRMKKSVISPLMKMTDEEYSAWKDAQKAHQNKIIADLS